MQNDNKETAKWTVSNVEDMHLKKLYSELQENSENNEDCAATIQKILDYTYSKLT